MTRHSRNCTANAVYSYHEKQKDAQASGFGSLKQRFSKDAIKDFDCCCLTLHPCREPVVTQDGIIYDKEAILEYILTKKTELRLKKKEYMKQDNKEKAELEELSQAEERSKMQKFLKAEASVSSPSQAAASSSKDLSKDEGPSYVASRRDKLPSFWVPSLTPQSEKSKISKPDFTIYCPMSGRPLKMKDLTPVKFTKASDDDSSSGKKQLIDGKTERYKCPVSGDILRNNIACAVIKTTGDVVTMECVELIKKDMIHPMTGQKLSEKDFILLQRGGTGFASANAHLVSEKARPVMQT